MTEASTYAAIMSTGLDCAEAAQVLKALIDAGDVKAIWFRDIPQYQLLRDEMGFPVKIQR